MKIDFSDVWPIDEIRFGKPKTKHGQLRSWVHVQWWVQRRSQPVHALCGLLLFRVGLLRREWLVSQLLQMQRLHVLHEVLRVRPGERHLTVGGENKKNRTQRADSRVHAIVDVVFVQF
ncbi:MAG: hypothetical protein WC732_09175 [Candidatus Omnitrophota bacterium]